MHEAPLRPLLSDYLAHQQARACAEGTVRNSTLYLGNFVDWLAERGIGDAREVTRSLLERYQRHLYAYRKKDGQPLAVAGQHVRLTTIQGFFRWLARERYLEANPAADLELPRVGRRLPRAVLTAHEAETVLGLTAIATAAGLRDRALLEVLYSTGMRRREVCKLRLDDVDLERGTVLVREGKGRKDRLLPLGRRAAWWLCAYVETARGQLQAGPDARTVFLGRDGQGITPGVVGNLVHAYIQQSGIGKTGSCHLFRHAMATLMLEGGADIRYIQQMLGHARLSTTEIYTHVNIAHLVDVHRRCHPAEQRPLPGEVPPPPP
jgi:integrase/recombinase XerD